MVNFTGEEKRKHLRVDVHVPVSYRKLKGGEQKIMDSLSINMSKGGLRFKTNEFITRTRIIIPKFVL